MRFGLWHRHTWTTIHLLGAPRFNMRDVLVRTHVQRCAACGISRKASLAMDVSDYDISTSEHGYLVLTLSED